MLGKSSIKLNLFLVCLLVGTCVGHTEWYEDSIIPYITSENYKSIIGSPDYHLFIDFFTPWCKYCKKMFHEFEETFDAYSNPTSPKYREDVKIMRVNAKEDPIVKELFSVRGYPTIIYIKPGERAMFSKFDESRTQQFFSKWIDSMAKTVIPKKANAKPVAASFSSKEEDHDEEMEQKHEMEKLDIKNKQLRELIVASGLEEVLRIAKSTVEKDNQQVQKKLDIIMSNVDAILRSLNIPKPNPTPPQNDSQKQREDAFNVGEAKVVKEKNAGFKQKDMVIFVCGLFIGFIMFTLMGRKSVSNFAKEKV